MQPTEVAIETKSDWAEYWGIAETESQVLPLDLPLEARADDDPYQLTPLDFQLADQTPNGENRQDFGIDVRFVGPGPAYDSWKKTVAYCSWQSRTQLEDSPTAADH